MLTASTRRLTGFLAMLLLVAQASPALCVAAVCVQRAPLPAESSVHYDGDHGSHADRHDDGSHGANASSKQHPVVPECESMTLCAVAQYDPTAEGAEVAHHLADRVASPSEFVLLSSIAPPDTPPPRA